jgi:hypothetical protein
LRSDRRSPSTVPCRVRESEREIIRNSSP